MEPVGYLHTKLDVKVLILFILARIEYPLTLEDLYEVAYQDDSLNYFTFVESTAELTSSGHIETDEAGRYRITEKGRTQGGYVEDSLAIPVVDKVGAAIRQKSNQLHRENMMTVDCTQDESGHWMASLDYRDKNLPLMHVAVLAPNQEMGLEMARNMKKRISLIYKTLMDAAINEKPSKPSGGAK